MRVAFATCVQLGLSCMDEIYNQYGKLDLLITLKDHKAINKSGRVYLDQFAAKNEIPLLKIENINDAVTIKTLKEMRIDWLFIIGWSQIAKNELINTPAKGCIGMHPTLLPEGRGRAAIPWAIIKGLKQTGVTAFVIDEGVDTGPIIQQEIIPLGTSETSTTLYNKVNKAHTDLMTKVWKDINQDTLNLEVQDEKKATYWLGRIEKDGEIKSEMTIEEAERLVRATTHPYPGSYYIQEKVKYRIWSAKTETVKPEKFHIKLNNGFLIPSEYAVEEEA